VNFLSDVIVADFSSRLPGPLSTMILTQLGAEVFKIEGSEKNGDPFNSEDLNTYAPHFRDWYKKLNKHKRIIKTTYDHSDTLLRDILAKSNIIIIPDNKFYNNLISKFKLDNHVILKLAGGKDDWKFIHDLNALALTRSFLDHLKSSPTPPFLPIAGISFGQQIATISLAVLRQVEIKKETISKVIYLKDVSENMLGSLDTDKYSLNGKLLHNGAFPCYNIYITQDLKYICLAAIEEKFWNNLINAFNLELELKDRFDTSEKVHIYLKKVFSKLNSDEIREKMKMAPMCLTIYN
jgi:alpha-methylacyl-CoA racemase